MAWEFANLSDSVEMMERTPGRFFSSACYEEVSDPCTKTSTGLLRACAAFKTFWTDFPSTPFECSATMRVENYSQVLITYISK